MRDLYFLYIYILKELYNYFCEYYQYITSFRKLSGMKRKLTQMKVTFCNQFYVTGVIFM